MMPRQGTVVADRYRLERKVGGGRVAAMWLVQDQVTDAACAIKLLHRSMNDHPEALARFSLEDRLSRELTGDYFPERVGSGSWHSLRYIAWRWYEGECLRSLFERNPKQDVQTVYSIVQETCHALGLVHAAGYSHGDLKPENLFFADRAGDSSRQLKLLGFGVASRLARPLLGSQARRTPGQIVGTPLYLSPDLILGRVPRGGQADLWALAVIVYEALTGRAPFLGTDLSEVLEAILERRAARPSTITNLPATFDVWWTQALEQQFLTPSDFSTSLARALAPALRSSRTQRSASLPDRISQTGHGLVWRSEVAAPRTGDTGAGRPTPAGGLAAAVAATPPRRSQPVTAHGGTRASDERGRRSDPPRRAEQAHRSALDASALDASALDASSSALDAPRPVEGSSREERPVAESRVGAEGGPVERSPVTRAAATQTNGATATQVVPGTRASAPPAAAIPPGSTASEAARSLATTAGTAASLFEASAPAAPKPLASNTLVAASAEPAEGSGREASSAQSLPAATPHADPSVTADVAGFAASRPTSSPVAAALAAHTAPAPRSPAPLTGSTAAGLGSSPLASGTAATAPAAAGGATSAGIGQGADGPALMAAARARTEATAPGTARREPPRPEASGSKPQSRATRSAEVSSAEPHRPNITSTTVAGIGPAALSLMRSRESAAASAAPPTEANRAGDDAANAAAAATATAQENLAALRDLAVGTRKTLVGIIAPAAPPPTVAPAAVAPAAAVPTVAEPAQPARSAASKSLVIAGTPCRSIEVAGDDEAIDSVMPLRRLGHSTVPFPRPRATPRGAPLDDDGAEEMVAEAIHHHGQDGPQSWKVRTHNTLRVVLTDPDHRPHLVAGLLVCSAAALVIFALGRSPVSGTGMLGQTTGSLSGREGATEPTVGSRSTASAGSPTPSDKAQDGVAPGSQSSAAAPSVPPSEESPRIDAEGGAATASPVLQGEELAPGLIVPPKAVPAAPPVKPAGAASVSPGVAPPAVAPAPAPVRPPPAVTAPAAAPAAAPRAPAPPPSNRPGGGLAPAPAAVSAPRPTVPAAAPGAPPPRAVPPRKAGAEPAPPRPSNPDFDFGI